AGHHRRPRPRADARSDLPRFTTVAAGDLRAAAGNAALMNREAVIAVNRFGLGAAPGELTSAAGDPRGWLAAQTKSVPEHAAFAALPPSSETLKEYPRWIASLRTARADGMRGIEDSFRAFLGPGLLQEVGARLSAAATTQAPFQERLALFWANHFTVSAEKPGVFAVGGRLERAALPPDRRGA